MTVGTLQAARTLRVVASPAEGKAIIDLLVVIVNFRTPALTVPQSALVLREGFSYVLRVGPDHRVAQLKVQTGRLAGDWSKDAGG